MSADEHPVKPPAEAYNQPLGAHSTLYLFTLRQTTQSNVTQSYPSMVVDHWRFPFEVLVTGTGSSGLVDKCLPISKKDRTDTDNVAVRCHELSVFI